MSLSLSKDQVLLSQARQNLSKLVDEIDQGKKEGVSIIKDGRSRVVMIATETYEQLLFDRKHIMEAIDSLENLSRGLRDYRDGKVVRSDRFFDQHTAQREYQL